MTAKRGRPVLAAQSLEAAFKAVAEGRAPRRPRNEFERIAGARTLGRRPSETSPTREAARLADYLIQQQDQTQARAVRQACDAYSVDPANVRKYLKRMHPTVESQYKRSVCAWLPGSVGLVLPSVLPLLYSMSDGE